jgi:hypothetical protein
MSDIRKIPNGIVLSAAVKKDSWRLCGVGFVALPMIVFYLMSSASYAGISAPEIYIVLPLLVFQIAGFLFIFYHGVCFLLHCAARVEITADMVSLKIGKITLRKLPADQILAVGFMEIGFGRGNGEYIPQLVLTTESAEDVLQKGEKRIAKKRAIRQQLRMRGIAPSSKKAAGYARFKRHFPTLWQGHNRYILLEFSQERVLALRAYLFSAEFLDDSVAAENV